MTTAPPLPLFARVRRRLFQPEWVVWLGLLLLSAGLRLWQLGQAPGGLYRDEAFNGLDALTVLDGHYPVYFPANNGREPLYIYLTALSVSVFGRTPFAVRLPAALVGSLTTLAVAGLARAWFGRRVGWWTAWLWTATVWPLHLGRIGFRAGLLPLALSLAFWSGTCAYRRQTRQSWALAGLIYGMGFYTYLAMRFTPLLLLILIAYLGLIGRIRRLWPGVLWWAAGVAVALIPLGIAVAAAPEIVFGRSGQVSILNPAISHGHPWLTLGQHTFQALGMFFWRGDAILRHNPAERPVFDPLMALLFVVGVGWCARYWRRPAAGVTLLWALIMLGPTILAEDTPHFLRAVGVLPAILIFPALGLSHLWSWSTLPRNLPAGFLLALATGSMFFTLRDYFGRYAQQPDTGYLFEAAARDLAEMVNAADVTTQLYVDRRYWDGWPSVRFLLQPGRQVNWFTPAEGLPPRLSPPADLYIWPYADRAYLNGVFQPPAQVRPMPGALARNDLDVSAAPLFAHYQLWSVSAATTWPLAVNFGGQLMLLQAEISRLSPDELQVDLTWAADQPPAEPVTAFVHISDAAHLIAQDDTPPGYGLWADQWWQPGLVVLDRRQIALPVTYDPAIHRLEVGVYRQADLVRLPVLAVDGRVQGDSWQLRPAP